MSTAPLVRLLQLASPALPVGAFSYSQGLESAIEAGIVHDGASAGRWIGDLRSLAVARFEAPVLLRLMDAWRSGDARAAARWNDEFIASRETRELRAETLQMGYSLRALLGELRFEGADALDALDEIAYPTAFAFAASAWDLEPRDALAAYLFAWLESQVMAALKAVPLGQTQGQAMLRDLGAAIPRLVEEAAAVSDGDLASFAPGLALASSRHETQYTRLFRS